MATFWIVCTVLSHFTQDAWSFGYKKYGHQRSLQMGGYGMSENSFNTGYRSMNLNTCDYGPCEVWNSNSYDHPLPISWKQVMKSRKWVCSSFSHKKWVLVLIRFLLYYYCWRLSFRWNSSRNIFSQFLQESNQFQ